MCVGWEAEVLPTLLHVQYTGAEEQVQQTRRPPDRLFD